MAGCRKKAVPKPAAVNKVIPAEIPPERDVTPQASSSKPTIPKLKIHLAPRAIRTPDTVAKTSTQDEESDTPITPPPPLQVSKSQINAAVAQLLGVEAPRRTGRRSHNSARAKSTIFDVPLDNTDSEAATSSNSSSKRKRAASDASSLAGGPTISTLGNGDGGNTDSESDEESEIDELDANDSTHESEEEDQAPLDIPFSVPCDGANSTLNVQDTVTFKDLMSELANTLSIAPKDVKVAYRFSTEPRNAPWSHLKTEQDLEQLFQKARKALENPKKGKTSRTFAVELKDLAPDSRDAKGKSRKSDDSRKNKKKKRQSHKSDSDDSDNELDSAKISEKKKSATQWIETLWADNACDEHVGRSCLKFATHHHQLTKQEIGSWAIFMTHNWTSTTVPPKQLKIADAPKPGLTNSKGPKDTPVAASSSTSELPSHHPFMAQSGHIPYPPMYTGHPPYMYPPPPMPSFMPNYHSHYPPNMAGPSHGQTRHRGYGGHAYHDDIPSSDPPEEVEDVTLFPRVSQWLVSLDGGPCGADDHNFSQFVALFEQLKYTRICDIADNLAADVLLTRCEDMAEGTAQRIISYAKADTKRIRNYQRNGGRKGRYY